GFNEESVVRAVAASDIPLISAIGHETDTTLIDYAADLRAPTPTAAAELAVPVRADLLAALADIEQRRLRALTGALRARGQRLADLSRALPNPMDAVRMHGQRVDMMESRLYGGLLRLTQNHRNRLTQTAARLQPRVLRMQITRQTDRVAVAGGRLSGTILGGVADRRRRLDGLERLLDTLGYKATLRRGYAVVRGEGVPVALAGAVRGLDKLEIEFSDGKIAVQVDK
ncbi:MAG: exodeoxyribonuclease VII large subunit, partial [Proteobacteria bacterium]|nr:exodeoxyribonuclease VII large subunit [Pseudomonadota bacterium]